MLPALNDSSEVVSLSSTSHLLTEHHVGHCTKQSKNCKVLLHGLGIFMFVKGRTKVSLFRNKILRFFEPQAFELTIKLRNLLYENFVDVWRIISEMLIGQQIGFCATFFGLESYTGHSSLWGSIL
jgi:hypothetical protein